MKTIDDKLEEVLFFEAVDNALAELERLTEKEQADLLKEINEAEKEKGIGKVIIRRAIMFPEERKRLKDLIQSGRIYGE